ncbi:MAG: sensor histidine kinase [Erythrobacter sp.]
MKPSFQVARLWIPLTIGLLIVGIVGFVSARTVIKSQFYQAEVEQSLMVIGKADAVMLSVHEMSSAQRAAIISQHPDFREMYRRARGALDEAVEDLRRMPAANDATAAATERLIAVVEERLEKFNEVDRALGAGDQAQAGDLAVDARFATDAVRSAVDDFRALKLDMLAASRADADETAERALVLTIAGLAIAALLVILSIIFISLRSAALARANTEIGAMAASLEARVAKRTADLADANEEIQRFAYIVSHDLRSPLVNIMGFTAELGEAQQTIADYLAELDKTGRSDVPQEVRTAIVDDMPEAMEFIRTATLRMDRLIKAILQISREGRRTLSPEPIDLGALFSGLHDTLGAQLEAADAELQIAPLPDIHSDRLALEQVFANLLDNAIKYLRRGVPGRIEVTGEAHAGRAVIRITDNGRGVAEADRRRIFELFRRAGEQSQPGEGIGLAHVQALLRRLGGQIEVQSVLGEGTCFTVTLPISMISPP